MILLTGASGLLGRHLKLEADRFSHEVMDIVDFHRPTGFKEGFYEKEYDLIVHCAAYTKVAQAETDRLACFNINVLGTLNLLQAYPKTPFVFISSEYAKNPINFYSLTKSLAEQLVTYHFAPYLIIRTLFKPYPWPYEKAFRDQFTLGDTVNIIAPLIEKAILEWDRKSKLIYIGTGRKTMLELAQKSKPDVVPNLTTDIKAVKLPTDYK